ncbi:MAG TPA: monovalent cation/H(+) antiporter subunit G [Agriterribacter sp.]|uniref:monovalent cation/H(+) antiporter subunit G n=1 Tax=Agriterribacter sp. TaxID=2821509 RepID=UPI002B54F267|nr:monovalent cation/H(+) antiporter subunit G [Agriterribacter sp.]HRQ19082.1 monovalent cation/H(+) antiporter subunit G [Agriterribacter sp.]
MTDIIVMILSTIGALHILVAAIGLVRMPDFYTRLSVTVKAATMGAGLLLVAVALHFTEFSTTTRALAVIFFLFVTAPVSGHMICRSAYFSGVKLWDKSVLDELEGKFNPETQDVESGEESLSEPSHKTRSDSA